MYRKDVYENVRRHMKSESSPKDINMAEIARRLGCDYRTVKKAIETAREGGDGTRSRPPRPSKLDPYKETVREKLEAGYKVSSIYRFLKDAMGYEGGETILKSFAKKYREGMVRKATIRFETVPGLQAQVDWKESMTVRSKDGEPLRFNVFLMVLGYSRAKYMKLTADRSSETLMDAMLSAFEYFGGVPSEVLFDNMRTVVDRARSRFGEAEFNARFAAFAKECGFAPVACRAYRPQTKGKVEALAKLAEDIRPYDGEVSGIEELSEAVRSMVDRRNSEPSEATKAPPAELLGAERKYLRQADWKAIRRAFVEIPARRKVGRDCLVSYLGRRYSVEPSLVGRTVDVEVEDGRLAIYFNGKEVASHPFPGKRTNYAPRHYVDAARSGPMKGMPDDAIERIAADNLSVYDMLG